MFNRLLNLGVVRQLIASGHLHVFVSNILLQILGFSSVLLVAKFLSAAELGVVKTVQSYVSVVVIVAGCGLTAPIMFYCADTKLDDQQKLNLLRKSILVTIISSFTCSALAFAAILSFIDHQQIFIYALYALSFCGLALTTLFFVYLQARQRFSELAQSQVLVKTCSIATVIVSSWLWGVTGFLVATLGTLYLGLIPIARSALRGPRADCLTDVPPDFYSRAGYAMVGTFITMLGQSSDFMLMDWLSFDKVVVGRYALASVFLLSAMTLTGSIQTVVTPKFTALRSSGPDFKAYLATWAKRMPLISINVSLLVVAGAYVLEKKFFGSDYHGFTILLAILLIKYIVWSNYAIVGAALLGAGVIKSGVAVAALTMLLSFLLGYPMGRDFGVVGIAAAQVLVSLAALVAIAWLRRVQFSRLFA